MKCTSAAAALGLLVVASFVDATQHANPAAHKRAAAAARLSLLESRATISCQQTADCTNAKASIPANSHQLCDRKTLKCSYACNSGYTNTGSACRKTEPLAGHVALASTAATSKTTTKATSTTLSKTTATTTRPSSTGSTTTSSRTTTTSSGSMTTSVSRSTTSAASSTTTTTTTCAAKYTAATMIKGTGTLPKPTAYVTKSSTAQGLSLGGKAYRIAGVNIYWLCQDENVAPVGADTDKGRIREALAIAVAMGSNTIRLISCSTSVGQSYSLEPSLNTYNAAKWDIRDYAIYAAGQYGLRVILPLTDNYQYYTGGKYDYLAFRGVSQSNYGSQFYTNAQVIADFQNYVTTLLTHKNPYNGKTWATDPTIMAFESGNELGAYIGKEGYPPASWTKAIMGVVRQRSSALIIDGSDGFYNYTTKATSPGLGASVVDIMTDHSYPRNIALLKSEVPLATNAKKNFLIGEFDWTNNNGGDSLSSYLSYVANQTYMGLLVWSIQGHDAQCCGYVPHNDGYSIYYPNGPNSSSNTPNILQVVQHFYRTTGRTVPSALPGVACPQPVF